ncbi:hypothetical protein Y1Q_0024369 [Alligator mississippiensis]|uniref:Uncharacterized protein n=1 Tax=Alligator mississippiensis TaxID=8496 RepID=A0A151NIW8_ALLMI|nr:hypothetical protein Y1Q_0024369 [Alligator mississippiensis]
MGRRQPATFLCASFWHAVSKYLCQKRCGEECCSRRWKRHLALGLEVSSRPCFPKASTRTPAVSEYQVFESLVDQRNPDAERQK